MFLIKRLTIDYFLIMFRHMRIILIEEFQKIVRQLGLLSSCPPSLIEYTMTCWKSVCHCLCLLAWSSRRILWSRFTDSLNWLLCLSVLEIWWACWIRGILYTFTGGIEHTCKLLRCDRSGLSCVKLCVLMRGYRIRFFWALMLAWLLFLTGLIMLVHRAVWAGLALDSF